MRSKAGCVRSHNPYIIIFLVIILGVLVFINIDSIGNTIAETLSGYKIVKEQTIRTSCGDAFFVIIDYSDAFEPHYRMRIFSGTKMKGDPIWDIDNREPFTIPQVICVYSTDSVTMYDWKGTYFMMSKDKKTNKYRISLK